MMLRIKRNRVGSVTVLLFGLILVNFGILVGAPTVANAATTAGQSGGTGQVTIELWHGITGPDKEGLDLLIDKFNQQYAGKIRVQPTPIEWGEYYSKVVVAVAGGSPPDLGLIHRDRMPEVALQNVLRPVDDIFESLGLTDDDFIGRISREGIYGGKRYGIPLDIHTLLLYYNQDHFDNAGLPGPPQRAAQFLEYARKLTIDKNGDNQPDQWGTRFGIWGPQWYTALRQMGGNYFGGENYTRVTVADPPGRNALQYVVDLMFKHKVAPPPEIWPDMFAGQVSMAVDGIWFLRQAQDLRNQGKVDLRVAKADRLYGDVAPAVWAGSHQFVVYRQSKDRPEKLQAIATFIDFMSRNSATWASYGQVAIRKEALTTEEWRQLKDHQIIVQQQFVFFPPQPWGTGLGIIEDIMNRALRERQPVEAALEAGKKQLEVRIKEFREQLGI